VALQDNALCSLDDVVAVVGLGHDPSLLERHINAASDWIEAHCRRAFHAVDGVTERHPAGSRIIVKRPPIRDVNLTGYHVANAAAGVLAKDCCPTPGTLVTVTYDGGFETIPVGVVDACVRLVAHRVREAEDDDAGITSFREGGVSGTRSVGNGAPAGILTALAPYRLART
jgi:hypothetical protein